MALQVSGFLTWYKLFGSGTGKGRCLLQQYSFFVHPVNGTDFVIDSPTVVIQTGTSFTEVTVQVEDDTIAEADEDFTVEISTMSSSSLALEISDVNNNITFTITDVADRKYVVRYIHYFSHTDKD